MHTKGKNVYRLKHLNTKYVPVNYYQIQDISENFCCREITITEKKILNIGAA